MVIALALLWAMADAPTASSHENPFGDISPTVLIEDGNFAVYNVFNQWSGIGEDWYQRTYSISGEMLIPRHRVAKARAQQLTQAWVQSRFEFSKGREPRVEVESGKSQGANSFVLCRLGPDGFVKRPLPVDCPEDAWVSASLVTTTSIGFLWSAADELRFSAARLEGFVPGPTVVIGAPAAINDFPVVSNLVWSADRWWLAWVRDDSDPEEKEKVNGHHVFHTVLSSVDGQAGQLTHHVLPGNSDWNTSLSLATHGGWLCAAWSAVDPEDAPIANIVTAFYQIAR